jgi:hypothetical protein
LEQKDDKKYLHTSSGIFLEEVLLVCTTCFNRFATKTNACCIVATCTYEQIRGLLAGIGYYVATPD